MEIKDFAEGKTKKENGKLIKQRLEALQKNIAQIKKIEVGINMESEPFSNFDIVLDSFFENYDDMQIYQHILCMKK